MKLLNIDQNAKTIKGQKKGYLTAIMYLAPAKSSGYEVCPMRSKGCTASCLNTAGFGKFQKIQDARIERTKMFFEDRANFMTKLETELVAFLKSADKKELTPTIRLNGTSDIVWESVSFIGTNGISYKNMMERFPDVQFYDYTKRNNRKNLPSNYHLTFSLSEDNDEKAKLALKEGINVAIVFASKLPKKYWDHLVVDGDETDLRFLEAKSGPPSIIGLKAKGKAKLDTTGFVRKVEGVEKTE